MGTVAGLAVVVLAAAGCGTTRGVDAYCETFYGEGQTFRQRFIDASADVEQDPFGSLGLLLAAPHDLAVFFGKLADVAPDDVRDDVETVRDTFQGQADRQPGNAGDMLGDPLGGLGALAGELVAGMAAGPAMQRVDTWTTENCGPPPPG
jgi:hypothetical protein